MLVTVKKRETMRNDKGKYVHFDPKNNPQEVEDNLAKTMIEFCVAEKFEGPIVKQELISEPIETEELLKIDEVVLEEMCEDEPIKTENKPKTRKLGEKKSLLFSEN